MQIAQWDLTDTDWFRFHKMLHLENMSSSTGIQVVASLFSATDFSQLAIRECFVSS